MNWNYRIMKKKNELGNEEFGIYEVYYDEKGKIEGWTENSMTPACDSIEGLHNDMKLMKKAFEKEVLNYDAG